MNMPRRVATLLAAKLAAAFGIVPAVTALSLSAYGQGTVVKLSLERSATAVSHSALPTAPRTTATITGSAWFAARFHETASAGLA